MTAQNLENKMETMISEMNWQVSAAFLRRAVTAVAVWVFPLGCVHGQDFEAVQRRLGGAVEAGELSLKQASLMMDALRRSSSGKMDTKVEKSNLEAKKKHYTEAAQKILAAVKAGKVSKEDAEMRLAEMRKTMFGELGKAGESDLEAKKKKHYTEAARKIQAAVKAGKVSKEDAEKQLAEMRKTMFGELGKAGESDLETKKKHYTEAAHKIQAAVKAGKVSKEDAERRLAEMRKTMFGNDRE